jgi:hypothetical protein
MKLWLTLGDEFCCSILKYYPNIIKTKLTEMNIRPYQARSNFGAYMAIFGSIQFSRHLCTRRKFFPYYEARARNKVRCYHMQKVSNLKIIIIQQRGICMIIIGYNLNFFKFLIY